MLLVKTYLYLSSIHGIGLFASDPIPKGTVIWRFIPPFDTQISHDAVEQLRGLAKETFLKYSYLSLQSKKYVLCFDDARFMNHADQPNALDLETPHELEGITIAARDIHPNEEITCDYRLFHNENQAHSSH